MQRYAVLQAVQGDVRRVLTVDQWKKLRDMPGVNTFHYGPEIRIRTLGPARTMLPDMAPPRE